MVSVGFLKSVISRVCSPHLEVYSIGPKDISVKRFAHFIYWWFPPASSMITECTILTDREKVMLKFTCHLKKRSLK